jgi:hypothetical protein
LYSFHGSFRFSSYRQFGWEVPSNLGHSFLKRKPFCCAVFLKGSICPNATAVFTGDRVNTLDVGAWVFSE